MAEPSADITNNTAARTSPFFLPNFLLTRPLNNPPMTQPISALETRKPLNAFAEFSDKPFGITKKLSKDPTVPDITPVSYPNNKPPKVATKVSFNRYPEFEGFDMSIFISGLQTIYFD
ncbi:hypothetical protein JCM19294_1672 [Nonlabens tegetincola]|uniref:Uncharacterized protein n=1 Tax=Nonlabens tegetincola TaxID=323273 RepID=A0A090Q500_9FLAO|nr:hypothetical protein JCM19294_1672 [Nonlabens tegetincola]